MATFQVFLTRDYIVDIEACDSRDAAECTEFFLSHVLDASTTEQQKHWKFKILQIKPALNQAFEVHEIPNDAN